jgi:hypothetical protein
VEPENGSIGGLSYARIASSLLNFNSVGLEQWFTFHVYRSSLFKFS